MIIRPIQLLVPTQAGLYCPLGDFYIDPVRPVARALITHAHSDHARSGHEAVLATAETLELMRLRYGEDFAGTTQAVGYGETVRPVNFGSAPLEPPPRDEHGRASGGPLNRRAEIWLKSKEWLADLGGAQIPDSDALQADACGPGYSYDSNTRLVLEKKDDMRRRGEVVFRGI